MRTSNNEKEQLIKSSGRLEITMGRCLCHFNQGIYITDVPCETIAYLPNGKRFANIQAFALEATREMAGIYTIGSLNPRYFSRGKTALAGAIIFAQDFDKQALEDFVTAKIDDRKYIDPNAVLPAYYADQLPPLDIVTKLDNSMEFVTYGLELLNEGWGVPIDNLSGKPKQWSCLCDRAVYRPAIQEENSDNPFYLLRKLW